MTELPPQVLDTAKRPDGCKILTTINPDGTPHSVVCKTLFIPDRSTIGVGRIYFKNTCANLSRDPRAEFLIWLGPNAFSVQCTLREEVAEGDALAAINEKLESIGYRASSVLLFDVLGVSSEGLGADAGKRIA